MHIVMRVQVSGTRDGQDWPAPGKVIDLPDDEAAGYVAIGIAREATDDDITAATHQDDDGATGADVGAGASTAQDEDDDSTTGADPSAMSREQLLALAAERGIPVDGRWGVLRLREELGLP